MRDEFALSPILTANQVTALRNLIALAYKIKCKWENKLKKGEVRKEGGQETVCIRNRWATKWEKNEIKKNNNFYLEIKIHNESRKLKEMCANNEELKINTLNLRLI